MLVEIRGKKVKPEQMVLMAMMDLMDLKVRKEKLEQLDLEVQPAQKVRKEK